MHPEPVAAALSEIAAADAIFTADTGMCNVWSSRYIRATRDRRLIVLLHPRDQWLMHSPRPLAPKCVIREDK